jgi:drug/metabolite transporter (DMT)-like permease
MANFGGGLEKRIRLTRRQSVGVTVICTFLGAAGQVLIKLGAAQLGGSTSPVAMITNPLLLGGYVLYGLMTVLFVLALRDEELSILYPIIALTYVWVTGLSVWLFRETFNLAKGVGVATIVAGVSILGWGSEK